MDRDIKNRGRVIRREGESDRGQTTLKNKS